MKRIYFQDNARIQDGLHDLFQAVAGWVNSNDECKEKSTKTVEKSYFDVIHKQRHLIVCEEEQKDDVKCDKPTSLHLLFSNGKKMIIRSSAIVALEEKDDSTAIHFNGMQIETKHTLDELVAIMGGTIPQKNLPTVVS